MRGERTDDAVTAGAGGPLPAIQGLRHLLGAGVYTSMPEQLPATLRGRDAVVAGGHTAAADAALRLSDWCRAVTLVTPRTARVASLAAEVRGRANVAILYGSDVVCVDGVGQLEAVVVRKIRTGALSARSAAAFFILDGSKGK